MSYINICFGLSNATVQEPNPDPKQPIRLIRVSQNGDLLNGVAITATSNQFRAFAAAINAIIDGTVEPAASIAIEEPTGAEMAVIMGPGAYTDKDGVVYYPCCPECGGHPLGGEQWCDCGTPDPRVGTTAAARPAEPEQVPIPPMSNEELAEVLGIDRDTVRDLEQAVPVDDSWKDQLYCATCSRMVDPSHDLQHRAGNSCHE